MALLAAPQIGVASALTETGQLVAFQNAGVLAWLSLGHAVVIGAIIGFGLWFWLIGRLSLGRVAPFALLQTVFAIAAGVAILHEAVSVPLIIGAVVCISGIVLTQLPSGSPRAR